MVDRTMADEILQRYENASHQELYEQLMAGDPEQIEGLAALWRTVHDTAAGLADTLRRDLAQLVPVWDSAAGREYERRVAAVVTFTETLAGEFDDLRSGLTTMAEALRDAQREAESPEETDDHDKLISSAGAGALAGARFGVPGVVVGGVIGGITGYNQDEQEKEAARQRMIQLVVQLSAEYRMTEQTNLTMELTGPPEELPIGSPDDRVTPIVSPPVVAPTPVPELNPSEPDGPGPHVVPPPPASPAPDSGTVPPAPGAPDAEVPEGVGEPPSGTGLLGAGGGALLGAGGSTVGAGGLSGLSGAGGLGAAAAGGPALGGGTGAGLAGLNGTAAGRGLGVGDSVHDRAGAGARRDAASLSRSDQRAAARGAGPGAEGETDEYLTWLTEDEMVWGDDAEAPPSVLGTAPPPPPPSQRKRPEGE